MRFAGYLLLTCTTACASAGEKQSGDPVTASMTETRVAALVSCAGLHTNVGAVSGRRAGDVIGGPTVSVVVDFIVMEDGLVDPQSIKIDQSRQLHYAGGRSLSTAHSEARRIAATCKFSPALKSGQAVSQNFVATFGVPAL
jgi:hypothetical protein